MYTENDFNIVGSTAYTNKIYELPNLNTPVKPPDPPASGQNNTGGNTNNANNKYQEIPVASLPLNSIPQKVNDNFISHATAKKYQPYNPLLGDRWTILDTFVYGINKWLKGYNNPNDTEKMREKYFQTVYCSSNKGPYDYTHMENSYIIWLEDIMGYLEPEALKQKQNWESGQWLLDLAEGAATAVVAFYASYVIIEIGSSMITLTGSAAGLFGELLNNAISASGQQLAADGWSIGAASLVEVDITVMYPAIQQVAQAISKTDPLLASQIEMSVSNSGGGNGSGGSGDNYNHRDQYLNQAQNSKLKNVIDQLYRPGATVGDEGTADALKYEFDNALPLTHLQKAQERIVNINTIIATENLSASDSKLAYQLLNDLYEAVKYVTK